MYFNQLVRDVLLLSAWEPRINRRIGGKETGMRCSPESLRFTQRTLLYYVALL
jgi:hypothetical protein